jgi:CTP synthase
VNNNFVSDLESAGLKISATSKAENLVEIVEIPQHKFFIATQFHPEFTSNPRAGHKLFEGFVSSCKK